MVRVLSVLLQGDSMRTVIDCKWCGKSYESKVPWGKFCGSKCRNKYHNTFFRVKVKKEYPRTSCPLCGVEFEITRIDKKYCSRSCRYKVNRIRKWKQDSELRPISMEAKSSSRLAVMVSEARQNQSPITMKW